MKILTLLVCLFLATNSYAQLAELTTVQHHRVAGGRFIEKDRYDSAYTEFSRYINNETFVAPYDYLHVSLCRFKLKDTAGFVQYLDKAIKGGTDTNIIHGYLRKLKGDERAFLDGYLTRNYTRLRKEGYETYDTALIKEVKAIEEMDQFLRGEFALSLSKKTAADANYQYLSYLQNQADSINYVRVARLIAANKFPGYHNCGAFASLTITLLHLGDYEATHWDNIWATIKKQVLLGNIWPNEVATITDNHYQRVKGTKCSYYGQGILWTTDLCDCKNVDAYRASIGLETLQEDYEARKRKIPDCYKK